jgi:GNAT superfamily N-acetyltransferase
MSTKKSSKLALSFHPATPDRWADLEALFGASGADEGCWCMSWRQTNAQAVNTTPEQNRAALKGQIDSGISPGLLAYAGDRAVGWCGVSPRGSFVRLEHTRHFQNPTTDKITWTIICLFVNKQMRKQGVASGLLNAAVQYALANGAQAIEAYPINSQGKSLPAKAAFPGTVEMFLAAGFKEIAVTEAKSRSGGFFRSIVRYDAR